MNDPKRRHKAYSTIKNKRAAAIKKKSLKIENVSLFTCYFQSFLNRVKQSRYVKCVTSSVECCKPLYSRKMSKNLNPNLQKQRQFR